MITNFEHITEELNEYELSLVPVLISGFKNRQKLNPIKAPEIIRKMTERGHKLSQPRLRKIVNHIRVNGLLPLIATSDGYYVSYDPLEIRKQIDSLYERARSIQNAADGLSLFIQNKNI